MLGSFPVTLYAMVRISLTMIAKAQKETASTNQTTTEEDKEE